MSDAGPIARVAAAGRRRRLVLAGAAAAAIAVVALVGRWASTPDYVPLYRDLELAEAGRMSELLGKSGVTHRLAGGGTEVQVPAGEAARARVLLAREGMPSSGRPGLELFDKPTWGMTDFTQRVTYQRALEGELSRTLGAMRGIERAQVHLLLPVSSPVRRLERPAGASVVLTLEPGTSLTPETVQGITYVVSNSVEQLSPDNVAVLDDAGRVLSAPSSGATAGGLTTRQMEVQRSVEDRLVARIEDLLATIVGPGGSRAEVAAQMSFDQVDRTVEAFDPDGQVLQNEQRSETGAGAAPESPNGQTVVSNQYQNSRRVERVEGAVGTVTRLAVSVLVDERALRLRAAAALEPVRIESMVWTAVGADSARGDRVSVMVVPFDTTVAAAAVAGAAASRAPGPDVMVIVERWSRPAIAVVAILAVLVLLMQVARFVTAPSPATAPAPAGEGAAGPNAMPAGASPLARLQGRLATEGLDRPEAAARVLRAWLSEN
jgi:flagellar M-ring protein FliF